jgi:hypothetical protein
VLGYVDFLTNLEKTQASAARRAPFRIGKELYEQKFALEIQSAAAPSRPTARRWPRAKNC